MEKGIPGNNTGYSKHIAPAENKRNNNPSVSEAYHPGKAMIK
jgi:hypothetical protein